MIGIGIDAVDVDRFRVSLHRTPTLRTRLFTEEDLQYLAPRVDPVPGLAARFAAREAAMKALDQGLGAWGFHDISVVRDGLGPPRLLVVGSGWLSQGPNARTLALRALARVCQGSMHPP